MSEQLSPMEVRSRDFKKTAWGFAPKEVLEFLERVAQELERTERTERELNDKLQQMNQELIKWKGREGDISKLRDRAHEESQIIRERAVEEAERMLQEVKTKAGEIKTRTEGWLEGVIAELEDTEQRREIFVQTFKNLLDQHYEVLREIEKKEPLGQGLTQILEHVNTSAVGKA